MMEEMVLEFSIFQASNSKLDNLYLLKRHDKNELGLPDYDAFGYSVKIGKLGIFLFQVHGKVSYDNKYTIKIPFNLKHEEAYTFITDCDTNMAPAYDGVGVLWISHNNYKSLTISGVSPGFIGMLIGILNQII